MAGDVMLSRFNPARDTPETLEAIFVKREPLARAAEDRVGDSALTEGKHHLLFVGPRGSGKSHLMALLAHRLAARDDLRDRLRIAWLNEDETTTSFVGLLRRIFRALGARHPDEFPEPETSVLRSLDDAGRVRYLTQRLVDQLSGRTLLVIVENLDELFRGLGEAGQMQWRAFLQERAVATTLATSQQLFDGIVDRKAPFFGFFQRFPLDPFTLDDAILLLRKVADLRGDADLSAFLGTSTGRDRVQALHHLAGGNPRVFIVLSDFIDRESLDELVGPFEKMIDEMTPYYQARIAWLSPQQREIVESLCRARYAVSVKEIADELLASHQTITGQLKDLRSKGYVRDEPLGREKRIELAEPLMRICVEAKEDRRGPARLFIDFLRLWYDRDELKRRLDGLPPHARLERECLEEALRSFEMDFQNVPPSPLDDEAQELLSAGRTEEAIPLLEKIAFTNYQAADWFRLGYARQNTGRLDDAIVAYDRILDTDPQNVYALNNKGTALHTLGRTIEALSTFDRALEINSSFAYVWGNKGISLNAMGHSAEALDAFNHALEIDSQIAFAWNGKGVAQYALGLAREAIHSYERSMEIDKIGLYPFFNRIESWMFLDDWAVAFDGLTQVMHSGSTEQRARADDVKEKVRLVLRSTREAKVWEERVGRLVAIYAGAGDLARLGGGLVGSLDAVAGERLSVEGLHDWRDAWRKAGAGHEAMKLPLRLFEAGMRFHETGDRRVLLDLIEPERRIVAQALGLDQDEAEAAD